MNIHAMNPILSVLLLCALSVYGATETEPNDSSATANPIVPGDPMAGQLASASDQDWFGFSTAGSATLTVTFTTAWSSNGYPSYVYYTVQVRSPIGIILASVDTSKDVTFQTGLPSAGTYYLVVREGPSGALETRPYTATVATTAGTAAVESEPNDIPASADPLIPSQKTAGQLMSETDQDWFSFSVSTAATMTVTVTTAWSSNGYPSYVYYTVQVRNPAATILASVDTSKDVSFQTTLPSAGTYYIVVLQGPSGALETRQYWVVATATPAPSPTVLQAQIYPAAEVAWNSSTGKSYVVEWTASLSPPSWFPLSGSLPGTGGQMSYLAPARTQPKGFYRIKEY